MKRLILLLMLVIAVSAANAQVLPPPMPPLDDLLARAEAQGTLRVMVRFAAPLPSGAEASQQERATQIEAVRSAREAILANLGRSAWRVTSNSLTWRIPYVVLEVDRAALEQLAAIPGVLAIGEDAREYRHLDSALPLVNVDGATAHDLDGDGWAVVIIDDGIQASHPFFGGRVIDEACFSTESVPDASASFCPNGENTQFGSGAAALTVCGAVECNHGTHVASIAASSDATHRGVAPGAGIIAIQVFSGDTNAGNSSFTWVSDQVAALEHVDTTLSVSYSIAAINMSVGGGLFPEACNSDAIPTFQARIDAIEALTAAGIAVVISSGNNGSSTQISRPGCIEAAMTVSSVDDNLEVSGFSNVNPIVDFFAPGNPITGADADGTTLTQSGTSMAAPFVTGAWAVLKQAAPSASPTVVKDALTATGIPVADDRLGAIAPFVTKPFIQLDPAIDWVRTSKPVVNADMESVDELTNTPTAWEIKPKVKSKCNTPEKLRTPYGECAAMLNVIVIGAAAKIKQTVEPVDGDSGDFVQLSSKIRAKNVVGGKVVVKLKYLSIDKEKIKLPVEGSFYWQDMTSAWTTLNDSLASAIVQVALKEGKLFADDVNLLIMTDEPVEETR